MVCAKIMTKEGGVKNRDKSLGKEELYVYGYCL